MPSPPVGLPKHTGRTALSTAKDLWTSGPRRLAASGRVVAARVGFIWVGSGQLPSFPHSRRRALVEVRVAEAERDGPEALGRVDEPDVVEHGNCRAPAQELAAHRPSCVMTDDTALGTTASH